jgi:hypothetical protein
VPAHWQPQRQAEQPQHWPHGNRTSDVLLSRVEVDEFRASLTSPKLALEKREPLVDVAQLADPPPDPGTLSGDRCP